MRHKWFVWLTRYWFLFPIGGFLLVTAGVLFGFGERSYIAVHDNMDLFLAQYQMLKNTGSFFKHGVDVPFLGGVSRDLLPSELSLYSLLYMLFPTYTAYVLGLLLKIVLGIFSFCLLAKELFGEDTRVKFRPHHFPFTEPSAEMDVSCFKCKGAGCRFCKGSGWIEILGCGMVHPRVFEMCGIDPNEYTGFAFGVGLERISLLKYEIDDMRLLYENDIRFLNQF